VRWLIGTLSAACEGERDDRRKQTSLGSDVVLGRAGHGVRWRRGEFADVDHVHLAVRGDIAVCRCIVGSAVPVSRDLRLTLTLGIGLCVYRGLCIGIGGVVCRSPRL